MLSRRRRPRADAGTTLSELVVAMTLTTLLGAAAVVFLLGAMRSMEKSTAKNLSSADARVAMASWSSMLQVADWVDPNSMTDRFELITPTKIVFYANLANRSTTGSAGIPAVTAPTKIALMLDITDTAAGSGRLVEVVFAADNTTPASVRQVALGASRTGASWVFTPYNRTGGPVDVAHPHCLSGAAAVPVTGLCAAAPINSMLDPTLVEGPTLAVDDGPLHGDGSATALLGSVARIDIAFTIALPGGASDDYATSAAVNSRFPS